MSKFKRTFTDTFDFDGDTVKVKMNTLTRKAMLTLAPYVSTVNEASKMEDQMKMYDVAADVLPEFIVSISGLTIEDEPVTRENELFNVVLESFYFAPLIGGIVGSLMEHSNLGKEETKNSQRQLKGTSSGDEASGD